MKKMKINKRNFLLKAPTIFIFYITRMFVECLLISKIIQVQERLYIYFALSNLNLDFN